VENDNFAYISPTDSNEITNKEISIYLASDNGDVEFLENGESRGYGISTTIRYSPATTFNSPKRYEVVKNGHKATKYYQLSISSVSPAQSNSIDAYEQFLLQEYDLQSDGTYVEGNTRRLDTGKVTLIFELINKLPTIPVIDSPPDIDSSIEYEVAFSSNFREELANNVILNYTIFAKDGIISDSGVVSLADGNVIRTINGNNLDGRVDFKIDYINKPNEYNLLNIYQTSNTKLLAENKNSGFDFTKWNTQNSAFSVPAEQLKSGIAVVVFFEKVIQAARPIINLNTTQYSVQVKDSDLEREVNIPFNTANADTVRVYIDGKEGTIVIPASSGVATLYFQKDFSEIYGTKKIVLVAESNVYGVGDSVIALITFVSVNDFPSITEISYSDTIDIPSFSDFNIDLQYEYTSFASSTVDVYLKIKDGSNMPLFQNLKPNGSFSINLKTLRDTYINWAGSDNVTLIFNPYNRSGAEELIGNAYEIRTSLTLPIFQLDEDIFTTAIFESFVDVLTIIEPEKESKYLTHLANFDNNDQILISNWENDDWTLSKKSIDVLGNTYVKPEDEVKAIILKLYTALPPNVSTNSTFWITKLMANPLVETIILNEQSEISCPPIKGPNFNLDIDYITGNSTNFESLDSMILSGSTSSAQLVTTYLSSSIINMQELNIEYASGSTYLWNNFTHFSSAKERVENFAYKVQLIERYEELIVSASTNYTGMMSGSYTSSISSLQEVDKQIIKKNTILSGFDGFEKFLYTSSSLYTTNDTNSVTWPYDEVGRISSNNSAVILPWYNNIIELAESYDIENPNWLRNNIPQYIVNNDENESLLLFISMIGHHFDNIYFHTKSIEKSRGLGYRSKDISDKILFDVLKSFNWDAKNLESDSKLWQYAFGVDSNGNQKTANPAKTRTSEVWRRIANNLPYLLKHKGTRRGVYALLACYGIPSSNLSILEFGGPDVTTGPKSKLIYDTITTVLNFNDTTSVSMDWRTTDKGNKPKTIELFVKPAYPSMHTLISGSGWNVKLSGSTDSEYGAVIFNYSGSANITTTSLPIFNGKFFGVAVSSGSNGLKLDVRQVQKEKTIFEYSNTITASVSNWNNGNTLKLGGNYSGSVDEFRLWSEVLNTDVFYEHASFPEMINGNSISASTSDLYFRLDFEYPKNLHEITPLINVDANTYFGNGYTRNDLERGEFLPMYSNNSSPLLYATAEGFPFVGEYPYQFEVIDRNAILSIPNIGSSRYSTDKVRFESQTLIGDLSSKHRSTVKVIEQSSNDSNRVGLCFSPTKELNIDIAKSLGGVNLDNFIGDPSDDYKSKYSKLDGLRNYYFQRFTGRNIYEYINLIKLYEKSMFEDIKNMLPARVKATTGLLIEPHILERSKIEHKKPSGDEYQHETNIKYSDTTFTSADNNQYNAIIDMDLNERVVAESNQYQATIHTASLETITAEDYQNTANINYFDDIVFTSQYYQTEAIIDAGLDEVGLLFKIDTDDEYFTTVIGESELENIGFGIYAENGHAIRTYFDPYNRRVKERIKIDLIKEEKIKTTSKYNIVVDGMGDPRGGFEPTSSIYYETKLNIQPYSNSKVINAGVGNIVEVTPVSGYLPTHYRYTNDLTNGLQNSFFRGCKNTAATTLDGSSPIESFISNPNTLKVNVAGRNASEPILEVE